MSAQEEARKKLREVIGIEVTLDGETWADQNVPELRRQIVAALARIEPPDLALLWLLVGDLAAQPNNASQTAPQVRPYAG